MLKPSLPSYTQLVTYKINIAERIEDQIPCVKIEQVSQMGYSTIE